MTFKVLRTRGAAPRWRWLRCRLIDSEWSSAWMSPLAGEVATLRPDESREHSWQNDVEPKRNIQQEHYKVKRVRFVLWPFCEKKIAPPHSETRKRLKPGCRYADRISQFGIHGFTKSAIRRHHEHFACFSVVNGNRPLSGLGDGCGTVLWFV
jgi:hypothetical protein